VRTVQPTASDEPHYLIMIDSLLRDFDFNLRNQYDNPDRYYDYYPTRLDFRHVIGVGEAEYPIHDPGLPLLGAIPFAIARRTGVLILMCVVAAAFAWRGYAFLRRLAFGRETALLATAAVVFLHPLFTYTTQIFPDLIAALVVLVVAELVETPTLRRMACASALVGVLPWLSVRLWLPAVGLGLVIAWWALRRRGELVRRVAAGAVPFALVVGAYAAFDYLHYRVFLPNVGYLALLEQSTVLTYAPQLGLPGQLLDRTFGLLSHAPLYTIAFVGVYGLWRRWRASRSLGLAALALAWLVYFVYIGNIGYWWSDGAPSSRYLLATIAFPMCALAAGLEVLRSTVARAIAAAALVWSAGVTLIYAVVPNARYDLAVDIAQAGGPGRLWEVVTQALRIDLGLLFPSLVRVSVGDAALTALWLAVLLALAVLGARSGLTRRRGVSQSAESKERRYW
jgi:hypothetical protein